MHLDVLRNLCILFHLTLQIVLGLLVEAADAIDANLSYQLILAEIHRELLHLLVGERVVTDIDVDEVRVDAHVLFKEVKRLEALSFQGQALCGLLVLHQITLVHVALNHDLALSVSPILLAVELSIRTGSRVFLWAAACSGIVDCRRRQRLPELRRIHRRRCLTSSHSSADLRLPGKSPHYPSVERLRRLTESLFQDGRALHAVHRLLVLLGLLLLDGRQDQVADQAVLLQLGRNLLQPLLVDPVELQIQLNERAVLLDVLEDQLSLQQCRLGLSLELDVAGLGVDLLDEVVASDGGQNASESVLGDVLVLANDQVAEVEVGREQLGQVLARLVADVVVAQVEQVDLLLDDVAHHAVDELLDGLVVDAAVTHVDLGLLELAWYLDHDVLQDGLDDALLCLRPHLWRHEVQGVGEVDRVAVFQTPLGLLRQDLLLDEAIDPQLLLDQSDLFLSELICFAHDGLLVVPKLDEADVLGQPKQQGSQIYFLLDRVSFEVQLLQHLILHQELRDAAHLGQIVEAQVEDLEILVVQEVLHDLFGVVLHVHPDEPELSQVLEDAAVGHELSNRGITDVAIVERELADSGVALLEELGQVFDVFIEVHPRQAQRVEVLLVHFDELDDEVGPVKAAVLQFQLLDIVVLEVALFLAWLVVQVERSPKVGLQMWQYKLLDHQILSAFLLDGLLQVLIDVQVPLEHQVFDEVVHFEQRNQLFGAFILNLVVLEVQIVQVRVVVQGPRQVLDLSAVDGILSQMQVVEPMVGLKQLHEVQKALGCDLICADVEVAHLRMKLEGLDHLLRSSFLKVVVLYEKLLQGLVLLQHLQDDLHAFAFDVVPAEIKFLDRIDPVEASAEALQAVVPELAVAQAEDLEVVEALRDLTQV